MTLGSRESNIFVRFRLESREPMPQISSFLLVELARSALRFGVDFVC